MPLILGAGTGGNRIIINLQRQGEEEDMMKIICSQLSVFVRVWHGKWGHADQQQSASRSAVTAIVNAVEVEYVVDTTGVSALEEWESLLFYLCCWETTISMMSMRMPTTPKTKTSVSGKVDSKKRHETEPIIIIIIVIITTTIFPVVQERRTLSAWPEWSNMPAIFIYCIQPKDWLLHPWPTMILPLLGISVTWMKMESLNSPNLVKACILQRMCTSYSFPMCRP